MKHARWGMACLNPISLEHCEILSHILNREPYEELIISLLPSIQLSRILNTVT